MGPVAPLLSIVEVCREKDLKTEFLWVGTKNGPEKAMVEAYVVPFKAIISGKLRRYFSLYNILDIFKIKIAFWQSLFLLMKEKPDLLISAGGFVSVPLHWAGALLGIPTWIHQQDVEVGLANKMMAKVAKKITTALEISVKNFSKNKTEWIGNPVRNLSVKGMDFAWKMFHLKKDAPVILALGGGTGSDEINKIIAEAVPTWPPEWQVIHLIGKGRSHDLPEEVESSHSNYHIYSFLAEEMKDAYAVADVVIARAGFATITEAASLKKPLILYPIVNSHQEKNAKFLAENKAAVVLNGSESNSKLTQTLIGLLNNTKKREELGNNLYQVLPPAKKETIWRIVEELASSCDCEKPPMRR